MKILRISLRNIASLAGDHTVDFTKAPLAHTGLFSISGPTGSGKSTLLDALCLALYDETPRMSVALGTEPMKDADGQIQQRDVRNLLRRGCGEGFAEVAFVGVDGATYTACWEVRRAQAKAHRKLQKTQHSLWKGNVPYGRERIAEASGTATEVKKAVVTKVGLSFDQFRRAVLLAQGDFATFLKARDAERAEILQALTGTERFATLSVAVFNRNKREEGLVQDLQHKLGASLPMAAESRAAADEELRQAIAFQAGLELELAARHQQIEWFDAATRHRQKLDEALGDVSRLNDRVQANSARARELQWLRQATVEAGPKRSAEIQGEKTLADALMREQQMAVAEGGFLRAAQGAEKLYAEAADALEKTAARQREAEEELVKARVFDGELIQLQSGLTIAENEHAGAQKAFEKAESELLALHSGLARIADKKQHLLQRISQVAHLEPFAKDREVWLDRLKAAENQETKKRQLAQRTKDAEAALARGSAALERSSAALPPLRAKRDAAAKDWKEASETLASFNAAAILSQRRNANDLHSGLQKLRSHLTTKKQLLSHQQEVADEISRLADQVATENARRSELSEGLLPNAVAVLNKAREVLRLAEAAASDHATILREALVHGQACPVCGSPEHPNAHVEASSQTVLRATLKRDADAGEKTLRALQSELSAVEARIGEKTKQQKTLTQELRRLEKNLGEAAGYAPELPELAALLGKPAPQCEAELERLDQETAERLAALESQETSRIAAEKRQTTLRSDLDRAEATLQTAEKDETDSRNAHALAGSEHLRLQQDLAAQEAELAGAIDALFPLLSALERGNSESPEQTTLPGQVAHARDPRGFRDWFDSGSNEHNAVRQLLEEAARQEAEGRAQLPPLTSAADSARKALGLRQAGRDAAANGFREKKAARTQLLGGRAVAEVEAEIAAALEAAKKCEKHTALESAEAAKKLTHHQGLLEQLRAQVTSAQSATADSKAELNRWIGTFAASEGCALDRERLDEWLARGLEWINREARELAAAEQNLATARGTETTVRQQLEDHLQKKTTPEEYETVRAEAERLTGECKSAGEAANAKRAVVLNDEERRRQTGDLVRTLEAQQKQAEPWQKLNALIGSSDGTRFRNIAQQWTLEILLRHANAQLSLLSGRYRLERLRESLNLLVIDLEMDGQQRSVHSLSGGESFLVSLGLALGLASLTSSRLLIESLFIDEGFGSLDNETLRVALNALSHLEAQGRKVGVISHVSEMVDAIPVQVRVVRGPGGASKVLI